MSVDRRRFLQGTILSAAAAVGLPFPAVLKDAAGAGAPAPSAATRGAHEGLVVDTNVHLFQWPFRALKYATAEALVAKLRRHGVREAWTGSYEALFHKNIDRVNARLAEACGRKGEGFLVPFGTVRPGWPDWEEDLRRCEEVYGMPGIRLYPGYQNYTLDSPAFSELVQGATERGLLIQIAVDQEDERMQHPRVEIPAVDVTPLPAVLEAAPGAKVQLLNAFRHVRGERLRLMIEATNVAFDTANLDGAGALERIMAGTHWYFDGTALSSDRLMVGSHMPFRPLESVLFQFIESGLTEEDAGAIMAGNAERLLMRA